MKVSNKQAETCTQKQGLVEVISRQRQVTPRKKGRTLRGVCRMRREQDLCLICGMLAFKIQAAEDNKLVKEQGGTVKHHRREET